MRRSVHWLEKVPSGLSREPVDEDGIYDREEDYILRFLEASHDDCPMCSGAGRRDVEMPACGHRGIAVEAIGGESVGEDVAPAL
jgi:hypothetical protein